MICELVLHLLPDDIIDNRLVQPFIELVLVTGFADVDGVAQNVVERTTREGRTSRRAPVPVGPAFAYDTESVEPVGCPSSDNVVHESCLKFGGSGSILV